MAIEGRLEDVSLADICQLLAMGRKTGCLSVTDRSNFGYIYFDNGRVVYATVLNRPDRLGELLVRNQVIGRAELSAAMEAQAHHPGKRLGRILVDQGNLTEEDLDRFITVQIEEAVYHLFTWDSGSFHFDSNQRPEGEVSGVVSINAETLLLEGARRVDELSVFEKKIPSMDLIFRADRFPEEGDEVELSGDQQKVLTLLDGSRTVEEVVVESGLVEFDVMKATFGLLQAGLVQRVGQRQAPSEDGVELDVQQRLSLGNAFYRAGMLEDAAREYGVALEADMTNAGARSRLAVISLRSGRPEDALAHVDAADEGENGGGRMLRYRAIALEELGRYGEALDANSQASSGNPGDRHLLLARAILLFKNRDATRALEAFRLYERGAEGLDRPEPIFYAYGLLAAASAGEMEEALRWGREGLTRYPASGPILVNLGVILERRGEWDAAEALYLRAVAQSPPPPQAHKNLGDLAYRRGDQAGARAHYERAVKLDSALGDDLYLKLGNIVYKEGDRDWAVQLWRKALQLNPGNEVVRTNLELISPTPSR